jgi:hypothetical protein
MKSPALHLVLEKARITVEGGGKGVAGAMLGDGARNEFRGGRTRLRRRQAVHAHGNTPDESPAR